MLADARLLKSRVPSALGNGTILGSTSVISDLGWLRNYLDRAQELAAWIHDTGSVITPKAPGQARCPTALAECPAVVPFGIVASRQYPTCAFADDLTFDWTEVKARDRHQLTHRILQTVPISARHPPLDGSQRT